MDYVKLLWFDSMCSMFTTSFPQATNILLYDEIVDAPLYFSLHLVFVFLAWQFKHHTHYTHTHQFQNFKSFVNDRVKETKNSTK